MAERTQRVLGDDSAAATMGKLSSTSLCLPPSSPTPNHPKATSYTTSPPLAELSVGPQLGVKLPAGQLGQLRAVGVAWCGAVWGHRKEGGLGSVTCGASVVHKVIILWTGHPSGLSSHACPSQGELCREVRLCSGHPGEMF